MLAFRFKSQCVSANPCVGNVFELLLIMPKGVSFTKELHNNGVTGIRTLNLNLLEAEHYHWATGPKIVQFSRNWRVRNSESWKIAKLEIRKCGYFENWKIGNSENRNFRNTSLARAVASLARAVASPARAV